MQSEKARQSGEASWYYSSGMSNILAEELRDYFDTYSEYLLFPQTELFAKIDAHSFALETDSSGTFTASSFGYATARDWTRLGELFLYSGMWRGEKIIPKNFVDYVRRPVVGSGGHYGASFWTNPNRVSVATYNELPLDHLDKQRKVWVTKNLPKDAYFMGGHLGQVGSDESHLSSLAKTFDPIHPLHTPYTPTIHPLHTPLYTHYTPTIHPLYTPIHTYTVGDDYSFRRTRDFSVRLYPRSGHEESRVGLWKVLRFNSTMCSGLPPSSTNRRALDRVVCLCGSVCEREHFTSRLYLVWR